MAQQLMVMRMRARAGCEGEVRALLARHQASTHAEPGNRLYAVCADADDPRWVIVIQAYADEAAVQAHVTAPGQAETVAAIDALLEGGNAAVDLHWLVVQPCDNPKGDLTA